jgi:hypothetical protein
MKLQLNRKILTAILLLTLVIGMLLTSGNAFAFTLVNFTAAYDSDKILVEWETTGEINTAGFYLKRSLQQNMGFT